MRFFGPSNELLIHSEWKRDTATLGHLPQEVGTALIPCPLEVPAQSGWSAAAWASPRGSLQMQIPGQVGPECARGMLGSVLLGPRHSPPHAHANRVYHAAGWSTAGLRGAGQAEALGEKGEQRAHSRLLGLQAVPWGVWCSAVSCIWGNCRLPLQAPCICTHRRGQERPYSGSLSPPCLQAPTAAQPTHPPQACKHWLSLCKSSSGNKSLPKAPSPK